MNWNLRGGVIIIGSLLWQDHLEKVNDNIRRDWRNSHLDIDNKIPVKVPIRYGRKSKSNIMTMVFSNRMARRLGFGYVVPFKKNINDQDELLHECIALSKAEGMKGKLVASWGGVLAYLLNDTIIEGHTKKEIIRLFKQQKDEELNVFEYKVGRERSCVTKSLKLNINWVAPILEKDKNRIDMLHFLLATATKPMNMIPTYKEIAETIGLDQERNYFINNLTNGILTADDFEIAKYL
jgi:hypothetical protein